MIAARIIVPVTIAAGVLLSVPCSADAFQNVELGQALPAAALPGLSSGRSPYHDTAKVSLFVFLRPGQQYSLKTLGQLEEMRKQPYAKQIHWVGIVSDHYPRSEVEAMLKASGSTLPIVVDRGDTLYGRLGVMVHPSLGIADVGGQLIASEPYRAVNYGVRIEAILRHAVGEIDESALAATLNPSATVDCSQRDRSRALLRLAEKLANMKLQNKALETIERCLEQDPSYVDALVFGASLTARLGKCDRCKQYLEQIANHRIDGDEEVSARLREIGKQCPSAR